MLAVCASASWYVPPEQGVHSPCLVSFVYDPLAHAVCCVEPVVAKWPGDIAKAKISQAGAAQKEIVCATTCRACCR